MCLISLYRGELSRGRTKTMPPLAAAAMAPKVTIWASGAGPAASRCLMTGLSQASGCATGSVLQSVAGRVTDHAKRLHHQSRANIVRRRVRAFHRPAIRTGRPIRLGWRNKTKGTCRHLVDCVRQCSTYHAALKTVAVCLFSSFTAELCCIGICIYPYNVTLQ